MPDRPLLRLPEPEPFLAKAGPRGGADIAKPARDRQQERLYPRFERLMRIAEEPQQLLTLRDDPASIAPERAIVFEVAGSLKDFYAQARDLGLEYLGDFEDEFSPTEDFYDRDDPHKSVGGRIYLAMPDIQSESMLRGEQNMVQKIEPSPLVLAADQLAQAAEKVQKAKNAALGFPTSNAQALVESLIAAEDELDAALSNYRKVRDSGGIKE